MRYIVVSGGVLSGLGKGITASSIGVLLQGAGHNVTAIKIDPYLNTHAGNMSPYEHGEVYVLDDGAEADLDLGNYERFLGLTLTGKHNITTGKVYRDVIEREGRGEYLGQTVQVVPHITDEVQRRIETAASAPNGCTAFEGDEADVCIVELGGTVGDIESLPFVEALRQFQFRVGRANMCFVHVSLVPVMGSVGEQKTKPTQQSVRTLMGLGITPDIIVCRSSAPLEEATRRKLAATCHVPDDRVLTAHDVSDIYAVPGLLESQNATEVICKVLGLAPPEPGIMKSQIDLWTPLAPGPGAPTLRIAIVGKYVGLLDSYLSIARAIGHAAIDLEVHHELVWIDAETLDRDDPLTLAPLLHSHCIIVPGGFGDRGVEGKILACQLAREQAIPILGICLGMQTMLCDHWRNVLGEKGAVIGEAGKDRGPAILHDMGKLRLGSQTVTITAPNSRYSRLHGGAHGIDERHRHRFALSAGALHQGSVRGATGLVVVGIGSNNIIDQCAAIEHTEHPFFIGVQYHPEFKSRPGAPAPLFRGLLEAALTLHFPPAVQKR